MMLNCSLRFICIFWSMEIFYMVRSIIFKINRIVQIKYLNYKNLYINSKTGKLWDSETVVEPKKPELIAQTITSHRNKCKSQFCIEKAQIVIL